jgi:glucose-6-phosphate isomerase
MFISYFDDKRITEKNIDANLKKLKDYREYINVNNKENNDSIPESSLYHCRDFELHELLNGVAKKFKSVKHVVLVGIGGSSLGTEAIHAVLDNGSKKLTVLDTISPYQLDKTIKALLTHKKVSDLAICIVSKSGNTTETLANAAVLLDALKDKFGESIYKQTIIIGNKATLLAKYSKKYGIDYLAMPEIIGGRFSVATVVGLVPLTILGHDVDDFIAGYLEALDDRFEPLVAEGAARIALYHQFKFNHYNFFAFEPRLEYLGRWYRQLFAESLGKELDTNSQPVKRAMVPTISTPVELHSVGQLYMSGVPEVYTDFVTFDDEIVDVKVARDNKLATNLKGYTLQEVVTALYGGVVGAYKERQLPYRATIFEESLPYSLGLFMAMRLREIMYVSHLLKVNAFDQPNVELYKLKTKEILDL